MNINVEKKLNEVTKIERYSMVSAIPEEINTKEIVEKYMS